MENSIPNLPTSGSKAKKRSIWFHLHFWIGWMAAIPIALICLTGGILIFENEIFQWDNKDLFQLQVTDNPLSVGEVLERYQNGDPPLKVNHLGIPKSPEHSYSAYTSNGQVFVNPYTGERTQLSSGFSISHSLIDIHRHLAAGKVGQQIAAISSLVLAITCIIGLVLWWPLRGRTFARAWKRGQALDWHNALGLVALLPLIIMAITGITFTWGRHIWPLIEGETPSLPPRPTVTAVEGAEKLPIDEVVAKALLLMPDVRWTGFQPSNNKTSAQAFFFSDGTNNNIQLFLDPYTGQELARNDGSVKPQGLVAWYRKQFGAFHTLGPYGLFAQIIWGLLSIGGTVLVVTGLWVSVKRWRRPKRGMV
jgi:sulfite reductase (NADPH) flavoprotein alpha-component